MVGDGQLLFGLASSRRYRRRGVLCAGFTICVDGHCPSTLIAVNGTKIWNAFIGIAQGCPLRSRITAAAFKPADREIDVIIAEVEAEYPRLTPVGPGTEIARRSASRMIGRRQGVVRCSRDLRFWGNISARRSIGEPWGRRSWRINNQTTARCRNFPQGLPFNSSQPAITLVPCFLLGKTACFFGTD